MVQVGLIKSPGSTNGGGKLRVVSDMSENEAEKEMFSDDKGKSTEMEHGAEITLSGRLFQMMCNICVITFDAVDQKERSTGNNPEKEMHDNGFRGYQRPYVTDLVFNALQHVVVIVIVYYCHSVFDLV